MEKLGRLPSYEFHEEDQVTVRGQKRQFMVGYAYRVCLSVVRLEAGFAPSVSGFSMSGDPKKVRQLLNDLERELDRLEAAPMPTEIIGIGGVGGISVSGQKEPK